MKEKKCNMVHNMTLVQEALSMLLYHERKYYSLMMISTDANPRIDRYIDREEENCKYWRERYQELTTVD